MCHPNHNRTKSINSVAKRAQAKRGFAIHLGVFGVMYTLKLFEGVISGQPFAAFTSMYGWAIGLAIHGLVVYINRAVSDEALLAEEDHETVS